LIDAPGSGTQKTVLAVIKHGDIAAIGVAITAGMTRFVRGSRNTLATMPTNAVARDAKTSPWWHMRAGPAC
jgi:hypothetical protein